MRDARRRADSRRGVCRLPAGPAVQRAACVRRPGVPALPPGRALEEYRPSTSEARMDRPRGSRRTRRRGARPAGARSATPTCRSRPRFKLAARSLLDAGRDRAHPHPRSAARQRRGAARDRGRLERRHRPPRRRRMVGGRPRAGHAIGRGAGDRAGRARRGRRPSRLLLRLSARSVPGRQPAAGAGRVRARRRRWCRIVSMPRDFFHGRHAGLLVPLFSLPSRESWGIGEIGDLPRMGALDGRRRASRSCSCCRSTRWPTARTRRIPR